MQIICTSLQTDNHSTPSKSISSVWVITQSFTSRMLFLMPNQQCQSTKGMISWTVSYKLLVLSFCEHLHFLYLLILCYFGGQSALVTIGVHPNVHLVEKFVIIRYNHQFLNMLVSVQCTLHSSKARPVKAEHSVSLHHTWMRMIWLMCSVRLRNVFFCLELRPVTYWSISDTSFWY